MDKNIVIESIGSNAFEKTPNLTYFYFPASLKSIGDHAFYNSGLSKVNFEDNHNLTSIPSYCFYNCTNLTNVELPDEVTFIGSFAFDSCSFPSFTLPKGVIKVGNAAFQNNKEIINFTIPADCNLTTLGNKLFAGCSSLSLFVSNVESYVVLNEALYNENLDTLIAFPPASPLKHFSFSDSIRYVGPSAFISCVNLETISIPGNSLIEIQFSAFEDCSNLELINIPESVTIIGQNAFLNCNKLKCGQKIENRNPEYLKNLVEVAKFPSEASAHCPTTPNKFYGPSQIEKILY
jgi:hypothetical protein